MTNLIRRLAVASLLLVFLFAFIPTPVSAMTGDGTETAPYIIWDVDDLQAMEDDLAAYYELGGNINATATVTWNGGDGFDPIGQANPYFTGELDGNGYSIFGLTIDRAAESSVGLIGRSVGATITDVVLVDVSVGGLGSVGPLVGLAQGSTYISDSVASGEVTSGLGGSSGGLIGYATITTVVDCSSTVNVTSSGSTNGGLIGYVLTNVDITRGSAYGRIIASDSGNGGLVGQLGSYSTVTDSYAIGDATTSGAGNDNTGGLIGLSSGGSVAGTSTITRSWAIGNVSAADDYTGGLIGAMSFTAVIDSYARGSATSGDRYAGGLVGHASLGAGGDNTITNSYSAGVPTAPGGDAGGLLGEGSLHTTVTNSFWDTDTSGTAVSDGGTGQTTIQMNTEATFTGAGWNFTTVWAMDTDHNTSYPYIESMPMWFATAVVVGVPDTANDWILFDNNVDPYTDYYMHTVADALITRYDPNDMIQCTRESGTADAGTATTLDDAVLTQADDYWNGARLIIIETTDHNAPEGETSVVTDFDDANDRLTFDALTAVVDIGDFYTIDFGTLPDREVAANDARITWGVYPTTGVSADVSGGAVSGDQPPAWSTPDDTITDVLPDIPTSDWFEEPDLGGLLTNPARPFVTILSDTTSMTELQAWRLLGLAFVLFVMVATLVTVRGHLLIAGSATGAAIGLLIALTIWPLWTLVLCIGSIAGGMVAERSPSL